MVEADRVAVGDQQRVDRPLDVALQAGRVAATAAVPRDRHVEVRAELGAVRQAGRVGDEGRRVVAAGEVDDVDVRARRGHRDARAAADRRVQLRLDRAGQRIPVERLRLVAGTRG